MSISDKIRQVNPRKNKSIKSAPVSEGGLGLSPRTRGSKEDDIRKAKENELAEYWYDKYENLVKEVDYHRKKDRQYLNELEEKVGVINEGLLDEIATISDSDPLAPLEKKFVTVDQLTDHYRLFLSRIQEQIGTIGGGGAVQLSDLDDVDDSNRGHKTTLMYNDVTGKYEAADPDLNAGISNEDHSGDEIILNATDSSGTDEGGSIQQENKTATAIPSPTGDIVHTGVLQTTGNASINGTLGVTGVTTFSDDDVIFTGNNTNMRWDHSTSDLKLFNNTRLEFGDNKDFEIWHGGSHTFMKNSGGDLRIRGNVIKLAREDSSEKYIECNVNSSVDLYFNGSQKFTTTTSGITVTGNIVISDDGNIGSASDTDAIAIAADGTTTFSSDVVVSDDLLVTQRIRHVGDTDTYIDFSDDQIELYAGGKGILTVTEASVDSVVINDGGNNCDTRIEGLNDENLLFVDGSTDRVGIGTDSPSHLFHVDGDAKVGSSQSAGVILTSPDGTEYRLIVANGGALSTSAV